MYSTRPPAEIWDPVTASVEPAGAPVEGGSRHTATLLPDGRVLVVGGGGYNVDNMVDGWCQVVEALVHTP